MVSADMEPLNLAKESSTSTIPSVGGIISSTIILSIELMEMFMTVRRNSMGKIKGFILNRKQYDKIRKMDHCQMTMWAESVYKSGYKDGKEVAEADSLTIDQVRECLLTLKGFGEKRVSAICDELQRKMSHTSD